MIASVSRGFVASLGSRLHFHFFDSQAFNFFPTLTTNNPILAGLLLSILGSTSAELCLMSNFIIINHSVVYYIYSTV